MRPFVIGFALPWLVLLGLTSVWAWPFASAHAMNGAMIAVKLFGMPVGAAWLVYELLQVVRPARVLSPKVRRPFRAAGCGLIAGLLSVGSTVVAFALDAPARLDLLIVALASSGSTAAVLLLLRRVRAYRCIRCDYDTRGLAAPRCPECGTFFG